ncbi:hypothetical protein [Cellulophaga sp. L1A9]|uniref:hypothetical protein n=1 Tax=Cellulophaga sp. L1A9 TaxID=2686362 RepID=UPI00131B5013|nr:hypothetical protein [Cellulophaga sp. L1A9]
MRIISYSQKRIVQDTETYFKEVIEKYNFSVHQRLAAKLNKSEDLNVFLENDYLVICLDFDESYSFLNINFQFYFKVDSEFEEIEKKAIHSLLHIDDNALIKWTTAYNDSNQNSIQKEYKEGLYELQLTNDLLITFYNNLLDGSLSYYNYSSFNYKPKNWFLLYFSTRLLTAASFLIALVAAGERLFDRWEELSIKAIIVMLFLTGITYFVYLIKLKQVVKNGFYTKKTIEYLEPVGYANAVLLALFFGYVFADSNILNTTAIVSITVIFSPYIFNCYKLSKIRQYYYIS